MGKNYQKLKPYAEKYIHNLSHRQGLIYQIQKELPQIHMKDQ